MANKQAVLGSGARFSGKISNAKSIEINGYVEADLTTEKVTIGSSGKFLGSVGGDIKCHSLSVEDSGTLKGNIDAAVVTVSGKCDGQVSGDVVSIKSTGKISGEVFYENISIEEGAVVEAQIGKRKSKN